MSSIALESRDLGLEIEITTLMFAPKLATVSLLYALYIYLIAFVYVCVRHPGCVFFVRLVLILSRILRRVDDGILAQAAFVKDWSRRETIADNNRRRAAIPRD